MRRSSAVVNSGRWLGGDVKLLKETDGTEYLEFIQNAKLKIDRELNLEISEQQKPKALATQLASLEEIQFFSLHVQILCSEKARFDATARRAISC